MTKFNMTYLSIWFMGAGMGAGMAKSGETIEGIVGGVAVVSVITLIIHLFAHTQSKNTK